MPEEKTTIRRIAEAVSKVVGYPPVKYLPGYDRGQGVFWERRDLTEEDHPALKEKVEACLTGFLEKIEVNLSIKKRTTRIFIFVHKTLKEDTKKPNQRNYGRTFGKRNY